MPASSLAKRKEKKKKRKEDEKEKLITQDTDRASERSIEDAGRVWRVRGQETGMETMHPCDEKHGPSREKYTRKEDALLWLFPCVLTHTKKRE